MNVRNFSLVLALVAFSTSSIFAQGPYDFFWSFNDLNSGAVNGDAEATYNMGDSGSLYLYWSTNGPNDSDLSVGAFLDVAQSMAGVVNFTGAETFDFAVTVGGVPIDNRWLDDMGGGGSAGMTGTVSDDFIDEWNAFTVTGGQGILEANNGTGAFLDLGYDAGADAFLFGRIDFDVVGPMGSSVNLLTSAGDGLIVNGAEEVPAVIGGATINVAGIPEPASAGLLVLGMVGLVARRRR